jgi:uncharacterized membrane protein YhiD involved in acid resistance
MAIGIAQAAANLGAAVALGAVIGFERQWRQRLAGLRTNTLVALGAASFVVFENLFSTEADLTRVAAQVVSGIGFEDSDRVEVLAVLSADHRSDGVLEQIVGRLSLEPSVTAARWRVEAVTEQ